jgi:hypothetical protein
MHRRSRLPVKAAATPAVETATATATSATTMSAVKGEGRGCCRKRNCQTGSAYRSNFFHDVSLFSLVTYERRRTRILTVPRRSIN